MELLITIDTEADNQWERPDRLRLDNLAFIPRFQKLCETYGFKPTYLCTYEVAGSSAFVNLLKPMQDEGRAEIGAHLHPWSNPPFRTAGTHDYDPASYPAFPSELPDEEFRSKMIQLTDLIEQRCGRRPRSYRAGRWGFRASHIPILTEIGYWVDCSVTPYVSWRNTQGISDCGPDFRNAPLAPYFLDGADVTREGSAPLLEVPMTICYRHKLLRESSTARRLAARLRRTVAGKALNKIVALDAEWLRPYKNMTDARLIALARSVEQLGVKSVVTMLHSSELMPAGSPYNPNEESITALYRSMDKFFSKLASAGYRGATMTEFASRYRENNVGAVLQGKTAQVV